MRILKSLIILSMVLCVVGMGSITPRFAKMTVKVIDEAGLPIEDAKVTIAFSNPKPPGKGWGTVSTYKKGKTDVNGLFTASGQQNEPRIYCSAKMEGYYESGDAVSLKKLIGTNWQPWNPTVTLILKKKCNPVPMYAKSTAWADWLKVPLFDQPIGYDLEIGDWVAPHGKGKIKDFIFTVKSSFNVWNDFDSSYTLSFQNPNDGIQEYESLETDKSSYKWPFQAPISGYKKTLDKFILCKPKKTIKTNLKKTNKTKYLFRVRTQTDKKGNITSAKYGKIKGEVELSPNGKIKFSYYFNPDGTPNIEFDTTNNLFFPKRARKQDKKYYNLLWSQ